MGEKEDGGFGKTERDGRWEFGVRGLGLLF